MIDDEESDKYWFARHSQSIIFPYHHSGVIGIYEAYQLPVAAFQTTNFP
jgi:hypothetical protein